MFKTYRILHGIRSLTIEITNEGTVIVPIGTKLEDGRWSVYLGEEEVGYFTVKNGEAGRLTDSESYDLDWFSDTNEIAELTAQMLRDHEWSAKVEAILSIAEELQAVATGKTCADCGEVHARPTREHCLIAIENMRQALRRCFRGRVLHKELEWIASLEPRKLRAYDYESTDEVNDHRERLEAFLAWSYEFAPVLTHNATIEA